MSNVTGQVQVQPKHEVHVSTKTYLLVGLGLLVLMFGKVAVSGAGDWKLPLLLLLSVVKLALVAGYYMHLRYDSWMFSALLVIGTIMATGTFLAVGFIIRAGWA